MNDHSAAAIWCGSRSALGLIRSIGILALVMGPCAAFSTERSSIYEAARAAGDVGERTDGYLGIISSESSELRQIVKDLNIRRKAEYTAHAKAQHMTVDQYAFNQACILIARAQPGEKYQAPDGVWEVRRDDAPRRDPRCP